MTPYTRLLPVLLLAGLPLLMGGTASASSGDEIELDEAAVFIEWNSTDGDFGIQFFWDGEAWERMRVRTEESGSEKPTVLSVRVSGNLGLQGLTEGFFESAEPSIDELSMEEFLERFPEGEYNFVGLSLEGERLVGDAEFTHALPAPVELDLADFPIVRWMDTSEAGDPAIIGYQVITELVIADPDERVFEFVIDVTSDITMVTVSETFVALAEEFDDAGVLEEFKVEVIAEEASGNKTITEEEVE